MISAKVGAGVLFLVLATNATAQDASGDEANVLTLDTVALRYYAPQHVGVNELYETARRMLGRDVYLRERGGRYGESVSNLSQLANRIVLYDERDYVEQMLESLASLDQPGAEEAVASPRVVREYAPRFIRLESALEALAPFERQFHEGYGPATVTTSNVAFVRERSLLILRDTRERVDEMAALLGRIDVPEPQAVLTCYLVRALTEGEDAEALPRDLVENLGRLVPQLEFSQAGFAMLQTSIAPSQQVSLRIEGAGHDGFELSFTPVAYDAATSSLTVQRCRLMRDTLSQGHVQGGVQTGVVSRQVFSTNTVFRGDEYTVLGASGPNPIFLVVRLTPLR